MIRPSPVANSLARLTVFPGDFSVRTSRFGTESPTLTKAGRVEWKPLEAARLDDRAAKANGRREDLNAMLDVYCRTGWEAKFKKLTVDLSGGGYNIVCRLLYEYVSMYAPTKGASLNREHVPARQLKVKRVGPC